MILQLSFFICKTGMQISLSQESDKDQGPIGSLFTEMGRYASVSPARVVSVPSELPGRLWQARLSKARS